MFTNFNHLIRLFTPFKRSQHYIFKRNLLIRRHIINNLVNT